MHFDLQRVVATPIYSNEHRRAGWTVLHGVAGKVRDDLRLESRLGDVGLLADVLLSTIEHCVDLPHYKAVSLQHRKCEERGLNAEIGGTPERAKPEDRQEYKVHQ